MTDLGRLRGLPRRKAAAVARRSEAEAGKGRGRGKSACRRLPLKESGGEREIATLEEHGIEAQKLEHASDYVRPMELDEEAAAVSADLTRNTRSGASGGIGKRAAYRPFLRVRRFHATVRETPRRNAGGGQAGHAALQSP